MPLDINYIGKNSKSWCLYFNSCRMSLWSFTSSLGLVHTVFNFNMNILGTNIFSHISMYSITTEQCFCIRFNNVLIIFNWRITHRLVQFYRYLCTFILSMSIVLSILLHGTEHRHFFCVANIVVINYVSVCCEDNVLSYRSCINHYKSGSILGIVHNTIISLNVFHT